MKLNQRIYELHSVKRIFVHPGMGDEGLAVGAALFVCNQLGGYNPRPVIRDVYWGRRFENATILNEARKHQLRIVELNDSLEDTVARLLADGKIIARYADRMEYGPCALGNRSILYQPTDPSVNKWLNERFARTEFMPFAPVVLWESRTDCFQRVSGAEDAARFMTITFDCTDHMKESCPAVCHVDGTARPQLLREEENPPYYRIVKRYSEITGLPCLVNTSFNMHEEPIVNSPCDAVPSFLRSELDYLILGNLLVTRPD